MGASLLDLALVAEEVGRAAAPAPVIEAQVAARLLGAIGTALQLAALEGALDGGRLTTFAVRPAIGGTARLAPAGAVCDAAVVLDGERLVLVTPDGAGRQPVDNLASAPLADLALGDAAELAVGLVAVAAFEAALDEWLVLTGAALVGLGCAALEIAAPTPPSGWPSAS